MKIKTVTRLISILAMLALHLTLALPAWATFTSTTVDATRNVGKNSSLALNAAGLRAATLTIANNNNDENPYDFAVQGTAAAAPIVYLPLVRR